MHEEAARKLIEETFNQSYSHDRFRKFIHELTKSYEDRNTSGQVPDNFKDSIKSVFRIGKFVDAERNEIDILAVTLAKNTSLDRARTLQRNFVARHLSVRQKEAALVAFVAPDEMAWRFSLVRREAGITLNMRGKAKTTADFSPARRFSFLVGKGERTHTVKRQLHKFLTTDEKPTLKVLESAFNIETVTDEFFKEYRELFNRVNETIEGYIKGHPDIQAHFIEKDIEAADFAKRLLGQIVFLYFLQKKGWLGVPRNAKWGEGSRTFLRDLYNQAESEKKNFFDSYLKHLFYEALNHDRSDVDHYYSMFNCRIPFLNGGLFEPYHDYEWSKWDIDLPNSLFHKLGQSLFGDDGNGILDVFDRYNFTVAEDEPLEREVAIDPEMLGKVFENLLEVKDRKAKGTYYTPREIVHYMCQESLIACLSSKCPALDKGELEDFIRYGDLMLEYDAKVLTAPTQTYKDCFLGSTIRSNLAMVDHALATVKVCDPAIGSGAFPVGMMTEIVRARKVLALHLKKDAKPYELKRQTIQDCLYGVDLDPGAIEIAKLRLWLSLVVDEDDFREIQALPNLDYKIMQGNSLLQTYEGIKLFDDTLLQKHDNNVRRRQQLEEDMHNLQAQWMTLLTRSTGVTNPKDKKALERAIQQKQKEIDALNAPEKTETPAPLLALQASAAGLADKLRDLHIRFFQIANPAEKKRLKTQIEELEIQLVETSLKELHQSKAAPLLEKIRKLHRANVKPYFLWKLHFSEVFAGENGGFDIVIANPPYVSIEKFSGTSEQKMWRDSFRVFASRGDIYCLFYEQGINLLNQSGHLCFIAPNKFFKSGYGKNLREFLTTSTRLVRILDFGELPVFDAGTDPSILLMQRALPAAETSFACIKHKEDLQDLATYITKVSQSIAIGDLSPSGWNFGDSNDRLLLQKIDGGGIPLGKFIDGKFYYGIKTGLNEAFVIDSETRMRLIAEDPACEKIIVPWLRGRDVQRWKYGIQDFFVIVIKYKCGERVIKDYPSVYKHLSKYENALRQRGQCEGTKDKPGTKQHHWLELDNNPGDDYISQFNAHKIIYADIAKHMRASYDRSGCFVGNTMYIIPTNDLSILGILNSKVFDWYARHKFQPLGDPWNGGRLRFIAQFMEKFPMPKAQNREKLASTVAATLDKMEQNPQSDVTALERQIDKEVYRLYGLTPDEIAIIESATCNAQKKAV